MNVIYLGCKRVFDTVYHNVPIDREDEVQPKWTVRGIQNCLNCLAQGAGEEWQRVQLEVTTGWYWAPQDSLFTTDLDNGTECPPSKLTQVTKPWGVDTTKVCAAIPWNLSRLEKMQILAFGKNNPMYQGSLRVNWSVRSFAEKDQNVLGNTIVPAV